MTHSHTPQAHTPQLDTPQADTPQAPHMQHRSVNGTNILAGIRVVVFALNLPGPAAAARLAANGASVVKIEPAGGDPFADMEPAFHRALHSGVEIQRIDLRNADARAVFERQLANADVLITAFRNASLVRLALDHGSVRARFPNLCHIAIVGHTGAMADVAGHDLTYQAASGLLANGAMPSTLIADLVGIERTVTATVALLFARARGSKDLYAEVSLAECADDFAAPLRFGLTVHGGLLSGKNPFYGVYQTRSGLLAVAVLEEKFWRRLLHLLPDEMNGAVVSATTGSDALQSATDVAAIAVSIAERTRIAAMTAANDELRPMLGQLFLLRTAAEWEQWGREHDLPMAEVRQ